MFALSGALAPNPVENENFGGSVNEAVIELGGNNGLEASGLAENPKELVPVEEEFEVELVFCVEPKENDGGFEESVCVVEPVDDKKPKGLENAALEAVDEIEEESLLEPSEKLPVEL